MTVTENEAVATEAPAKPKRKRRSPVELKAARVAKAQREVERLEKSGDKIRERAAAAAAKAAAAKASADEYDADLAQARATLEWEKAKPVKGESAAPSTGDVEDDEVDDLDDVEDDEDEDDDEFGAPDDDADDTDI